MFDILLKNGYVCDGTGAPCFQADIGITGDRIAFIGKAEEGEAAKNHRRFRQGDHSRLHRFAYACRSVVFNGTRTWSRSCGRA